jgi:thioesterase domain-containing protein
MSKDALNTLRAIQSLASADLSQTSDDEIRSEIAQSGKDPDALASEIADRLDNITAEFMRQQVAAAKATTKATSATASRIRPSIEKIKRLVQGAFAQEPKLAAAFREGTKQTDNDWITLFDDLVEMGKIGTDADG